MNHRKSSKMTEELLNKIISVAYGDASLRDKIIVMRAASSNEEVLSLLNSYKSTASKVKELGEEEFPRELLKSVERKTIPVKTSSNKFIYDFISIILARPVMSAATSVILVAAIISSLIINRPVKYQYSPAQITEAEKQAKYAFAVVGKLLNETHSTLKNEVLGNAVAKPFGKSFGIVNNLLEGNRNETN